MKVQHFKANSCLFLRNTNIYQNIYIHTHIFTFIYQFVFVEMVLAMNATLHVSLCDVSAGNERQAGGKRHTSTTLSLSSFFFFSIMEIELLPTSSFQRGERTVTWMKGNESTFIKYHQDPPPPSPSSLSPTHGDRSNFPSRPCHIRLTLSEMRHCVYKCPVTHPDVASVFLQMHWKPLRGRRPCSRRLSPPLQFF